MTLLHIPHTNIGGDAGGLPSAILSNTGDPAFGIIYSGIKFDADGDVYRRQVAGGWGRIGTWLLSGVNTDYSISRIINSGTLTTDAGSGDLQLNTDRIFDVQNSTPSSTETASILVTLSNWNGGSPDTEYDMQSYLISATMESP